MGKPTGGTTMSEDKHERIRRRAYEIGLPQLNSWRSLKPTSFCWEIQVLTSRRSFLKLFGAVSLATFGLASYALAIEPRFRLRVTHYKLLPPRWPTTARPLRIVVVADIHACEPWMPVSRIDEIVAVSNSLQPDIILLLGDYVMGVLPRYATGIVPDTVWGNSLSKLSAPLGCHAILGNHDWWHGVDSVRAALVDNGIPVLENTATLIRPQDGPAFWLAGLGDQWAKKFSRGVYQGVDDLPGTMAGIPDDGNPILLLAHEPDIFITVLDRVSLTLCGRTHGGQVRLPFIGPPSSIQPTDSASPMGISSRVGGT
ncbi:metallophosphoesterase [Mesorhizobium sp. M0959]|uniref:metallophosphoesterase n=1 Tax=unclassified Mesorhizobium TaxID=325217 RepID=UPI00333896C6